VNDVAGTMEECKIVSDHSLINIGYTHAWQEEYVQPLKRYFRASCQSVEEVLEARKMGWSASLIVSEQFMSGKKTLSLPNGETAFLCPARHGVAGKKDITCNDCTLCKVSPKTESKTVVFIAHGNNGTLNKIRGKIS
jgi:hypothetical protein